MKIDYYNIPDKISPTNFDFSLDDLKLVLILKNKSENVAIEALLTNISKSVEADNPKNHHIVDLAEFNRLSSNLIQSNRKHLVIAFGLSPNDLNWQVNYLAYETIHIRNIDLIFAHAAEEMVDNKSHKINLWSILKEYTF